jgi:hypothetical protein
MERLFLLILFLGWVEKIHANATSFRSIPVSGNHTSILEEKCEAFLAPILSRQQSCMLNAKNTVDVCVNFVTDVEFLLPFIIHHLALGAHKIFIYNNDAQLEWYYHPTIVCLASHDLIFIQPFPGRFELLY